MIPDRSLVYRRITSADRSVGTVVHDGQTASDSRRRSHRPINIGAMIVFVTTVRSATLADVAAVADLWEREGGPTQSAGRAQQAVRLLEYDGGALLVAEVSERVVGTLIVGWDGWRCHLYRLTVEPSARRAGVASDLAHAARERATEVGAARLDAMVGPDNEAAVAFWEAAGFKLDRDHRWSFML